MIDCIEFADAAFCEGPSLQECPSGIEVPETEQCNSMLGNDLTALGAVPDEVDGSCEEDGSCDDSCTPPARDDCTQELVTEPAPLPIQELPATGLDPFHGLIVALALVAGGGRLIQLFKITRKDH